MKRTIAVLAASLLFAVPSISFASSFTQPQINAIIGLLQAFNVSQTVIDTVLVELTPTTITLTPQVQNLPQPVFSSVIPVQPQPSVPAPVPIQVPAPVVQSQATTTVLMPPPIAPAFSVSTNPAYGDQTFAVGMKQVKIGSFILTGSNSEDMNVSNLGLSFSGYQNVSNLVMRDSQYQYQIGATIVTATSSVNYFEFGSQPKVLENHSMSVDIYADVSPAASGIIQASVVSAWALGAVDGISAPAIAPVSLQKITTN